VNGVAPDGSGNVAGASIASTAQAQAGSSNTVVVSPLRLREGLNATGAAPVYACRAWVNFNGTGTTVAIRASGNVSSVTDNGVGNYTVNFTTAMPDSNYAAVGSCSSEGGAAYMVSTNSTNWAASAPTTSSCRIITTNAGNVGDSSYVSLAIFR
jgi:hypothetical protein